MSGDGWRGLVQHYGGFLVAGGLAVVIDAGILALLTREAGWNPLVARPVGIAVATLVSWLINRTVTFAAATPPSLTELARYIGVIWVSLVVNYGVFVALLAVVPSLDPILAVVLAALVSMFVSYAGFRYAVFRAPTAPVVKDAPP